MMGSAKDSAFAELAVRLVRHRFLACLGLVLVLLMSAAGLPKLKVDLSLRSYLLDSADTVRELERHQKRWGGDTGIVQILVETSQPSLLATEPARVLSELTRALLADKMHVRDAFGIANAPLLRGELLSDALSRASEARQIRASLASDPLLVPSWLSEDQRSAMILVRLQTGDDRIESLAEPLGALRRLIAAAETRDVHLQLTGASVVRSDATSLAIRDQLRLIPAAATLMLGLLLFAFRSLRGLIVPLFTLTATMTLLAGLMGHCHEPIELLNQAVFLVVSAIAVNDAVYLLHQFDVAVADLARRAELTPEQIRSTALRRSMRDAGPPCLLTALLTFIGFVSLYSSDMTALRSFGRVAGAGVLIGFCVVMLGVPILLSVLPLRLRSSEAPIFGAVQSDRVSRLIGSASRHPRLLLGVALLAALASALLTTRLIVDNRISDLLSAGHPTRRAMERIDAQLGGSIVISVEIFADDRQQLLREVRPLLALDRGLRKAIPEARAIIGPHTVLASIHDDVRPDDDLLEIMDQPAMSGFIAPSEPALRLLIGLPDVGGRRMQEIESLIQTELRRAFGAESGVRGQLAGTARAAFQGINRITIDLAWSLATEFLIVSFLMLLLTRSLRVGLVVLIVNALPLLIGCGVMGLLRWQLTPGPAVIFATVLGIAIDDTVHLLAAASRRVAAGSTLEQAIAHTTRSCGWPVVVATLVLLCAFAIQLLSSFPTIVTAAGLALVAMLAGVVSDLLLLPPLLLGPLRPRATLRLLLSGPAAEDADSMPGSELGVGAEVHVREPALDER